jgi:hypothetical protein
VRLLPAAHRECSPRGMIEPLRIVYPDGTVKLTPVLTARHTTTHASYISSCTGLALSATAPAALLSHMPLTASAGTDGDTLAVAVQYGQASAQVSRRTVTCAAPRTNAQPDH